MARELEGGAYTQAAVTVDSAAVAVAPAAATTVAEDLAAATAAVKSNKAAVEVATEVPSSSDKEAP